MKIKKIGIIGGTNGIGRSFASFFENCPNIQVKMYVSGRVTPCSNEDIVRTCDLVIFSIPIARTVSVIESLIEFSHKDQIWMDFTSIKEQPVNAMLKSKAQVCGGHPLFGPLRQIKGQKMVLTPARITDENLVALKSIFSNFELLETTPQKHDKIMGVVQNLSHFSDFVLGKTLKDANIDLQEILDYSSPPYRIKLDLLARIFSQSPDLYADISAYNTAGRKVEETFMQATEFFQKKILNGKTIEVAQEFKAIKNFLGEAFCDRSWERSQQVLDFEKTLLQKEKKREERDLDLKKTAKWAIFGQAYSHTDEASSEFRKDKDSVVYFRNIFEVFDAVEEGRSEVGIIPYENSTKGSIFETLDELFDREVIHIVTACEKTISQNLLCMPDAKKAEITRILSHPQALAQSQHFLRSNLPKARFENRRSTALAAQEVAEGGKLQKAAIGSKLLAKKLGLKVLFEDMQEEENKTRFILISKSDSPQFKTPKHVSFVFWFSGDESGSLAKVLTLLAKENINLSKLDSRRASKEYGGYLFFVDAEVELTEFEEILPKIQKLCGGIRKLGVF